MLIKNIEKIKLVSCDIFDTLIYRLVAKPEDIFTLVQKRYELFYNESLPHDYKYVRKFAEKAAREKETSKEIFYDDIFDYLPYKEDVIERLKILEFELEKENLVMNDEVYLFLQECVKNKMNVILTSDMYFSKKQLIELLSSIGCDVSIFHNIYVSSEYKASKANSNLYKIILNDFTEVLPNEMIHIGDNFYSDYIVAKNLGIESYHYSTLLERIDSIYNLEERWMSSSIPELRGLRKLSECQESTYNEEERASYNIGSQIFGPVYSLFVEWVIDYAIKNNITKICPLMREGELYTRLLKNEIEKKNLNLEIAPIFVSRKATFLPSIDEFNEEIIEDLLDRQSLSLNDLFGIILIPIESTEFFNLKDKRIKELSQIKMGSSNVKKELYNYLNSFSVKEIVNSNIKIQKQYFKKYLKEIVKDEKFITIDLAGNGTIQTQIDDTLNCKNESHHLLILGRVNTLRKVIKGYNFKAWLGYDDFKNEKIKTFFRSPEIIEAVTNISGAGTSHYSILETGEIIPISTNTIYPEKSIIQQAIIWRGIEEFQFNWLELDRKYKLKSKVMENKEGFINIFARLINYPLFIEAKFLGEMIQDDQFSYSRMGSIINTNDLNKLEKMNVESFLGLRYESYTNSQVYWPQGTIEVKYPNYFLMKYYKEKLIDNDYIKIYNVISSIVKDNYKKICVYGAGEIGKKILYLAQLYSLEISAFIDRNYDKIKEDMGGIPVIGIEYLNEEVDLIIIGSQAFYSEIRSTIIEHYNNKNVPNILGLDN